MTVDKLGIRDVVARALAEDLGKGDITTDSLITGEQQGTGIIVAKKEGILAGIEVAAEVFRRVDPELRVELILQDGARLEPGARMARVSGSIAGILKAERTALNFLQRLSGIASETRRYVERVQGLPVHIMDTRKTTPGLRSLEKYAVRVGGGQNHRMNLGDGMLIKDNHLAALRSQGLSIKQIVAKAIENATLSFGGSSMPSSSRESSVPLSSRDPSSPLSLRRSPSTEGQIQVEVEAATVADALEAADAGADIVMLDNMSLDDMRKAVKAIRGRALIEASGGITLDSVRAVAETGVDFISVGALTHSAPALDISLELEV
jgi:nicotinate-nucleotide pyrophosphorylase (carboxylating)